MVPLLGYLVPPCSHLTQIHRDSVPDPADRQNYLENLGEKYRFLPHSVHQQPNSLRLELRNTVNLRELKTGKATGLKDHYLREEMPRQREVPGRESIKSRASASEGPLMFSLWYVCLPLWARSAYPLNTQPPTQRPARNSQSVNTCSVEYIFSCHLFID